MLVDLDYQLTYLRDGDMRSRRGLAFDLYNAFVVSLYSRVAHVTVPHPLPDGLVALIAERFRVLADPMRLKLLDRLREREACVAELVAATGASQQVVSKHLGILAGAGIVGRRRAGNRVYYGIADEGVLGLCDLVCGSLRRSFAELDALLPGTS
jgi:DNA-binding transcriptional ArsR family regulator